MSDSKMQTAVVDRVSRKAKEEYYDDNDATTAVNVIIDDDGAVGEGAANDTGGGGNVDYIDGGGCGNDVNITSFLLSFLKF